MTPSVMCVVAIVGGVSYSKHEKLDYKHGNREEATRWYINQYLFNQAAFATIKDIRAYREDIDRDEVAKVIKAMPYKQFLNTIYWIVISEQVKKERNHRCCLCGKIYQRLDIHHSSYEHHGYELEYRKKDLICLCHDCHLLYHSNGKI